MQYYLCPRCKFTVAAKKNVCPTCGYDMQSLKQAQSNDEEPIAKPPFMARLFGGQKPKEQAKEKPALS